MKTKDKMTTVSDLQHKQPLLKTKISIPLLPEEFVHRPRLTERISQGVKGPLTLISAPAGFGKTNALIEWAKETKFPVAWLTIDRDDNDPGRFSSYLVGSIQAVYPGLGEEALDFIQSTKSRGWETAITLFLNQISALQKDLVLALDEFQVLESEPIVQGINYLLRHCPRNLHLIIASRREPAFDLAFLRAKGKVVELGVDELRFTRQEIELFLREAMDMQFPPETIATLEKNTDGWITGLQMAAISMRHRANPADLPANLQVDSQHLMNFLASEVLDRQPEEVRLFLLKSSVLEEFCGPLCEAVVKPGSQPGYGAAMLDQLEQANLFIVALDGNHEWFRYHPLFSELLRRVLAEINPSEILLLKKRAAEWFEQQANLEKAIKYAIESGNDEWAADLIERSVVPLVRTGEIFPLSAWIGRLPDEVIHRRPVISLTYAWGLIASFQLDTARYWLDDIQKGLDQTGKPASPDSETENGGLWNIRGGLAVCRSTMALLSGDTELAARFAEEAANYLQGENLFMRSLLSLENSLYFILAGDTSKAIESLRETVRMAQYGNNQLVVVLATCQLAEQQALQGHLSQALITLQKARYITTSPEGIPYPLSGIVDIAFGEILLERDSLDQAREHLERGCQIAKKLWSPSSLDGMVSLARLLQIQGDHPGSQAIMDAVSQMALDTESGKWDNTFVSAVFVRLALQRRDFTSATHWWKKGGFPDLTDKIALENFPYLIYEYLQLTQVRFILAVAREAVDRRQMQWALELLEPLLRASERFGRLTSQIEVLILQSLVQDELGNREQSVEILTHALALGEPEDYRRIFLDEGQPLANILARCRASRQDTIGTLPSLGYIDSLLEVFKPELAVQPYSRIAPQSTKPATARTDYGLPISLSAREMEVLSLIAEGKSNQEISAQLFLALNTVKRHAYNIYTKLEVKKRTQAVSRARQLGLIP
ncbi:MAG: LuxR C-terminal-related transcriptional regulator [Chloroflexota bacterium]